MPLQKRQLILSSSIGNHNIIKHRGLGPFNCPMPSSPSSSNSFCPSLPGQKALITLAIGEEKCNCNKRPGQTYARIRTLTQNTPKERNSSFSFNYFGLNHRFLFPLFLPSYFHSPIFLLLLLLFSALPY